MKIRQVGAVLYGRSDGQTQTHDEANSRFSQFYQRVWSHSMIVIRSVLGPYKMNWGASWTNKSSP